MNKLRHPLTALFFGLLTAQVIAFLQVFFSNQRLYKQLLLIEANGYLAIPNHAVQALLRGIKTPFFGGLYFSLSVGLGLCLFTFAGIWIWDRIFSRSPVSLLTLLLLWAGCLGAVNSGGFNPWATSYFVMVPTVTAPLFLRWLPSLSRRQAWQSCGVFFLPLIILAAAWLFLARGHDFIQLRDTVFLSNPPGVALNDFYYEYTMYPAEAFKSLEQKSIKTFSLAEVKDDDVRKMLQRLLIKNDYLPVSEGRPVDLYIQAENDTLFFHQEDKTILRAGLEEFTNEPNRILQEFSMKTDTNFLFRPFIFWSIVFSIPVIVFASVFMAFRFGFALFLPDRISSLAASACSLGLGLAFIVFLQETKPKEIDPADLYVTIQSENLGDRITALQYMTDAGKDAGGAPNYRQMLASPFIAERYYLARSLGNSRRSDTYYDLLALLDDPQPNVVCMALYALGQRGDKRAVRKIIGKVKSSDHWYEQWYGYRALKRMGWSNLPHN